MIRPTPLVGTPFNSNVIGTTANFITPNSIISPIPGATTRIIPPIMPTINTLQTTNYQTFPPIIPSAATTTTYIQQQPSVTIMEPPYSSRGLLNTGIRPITPPIGIRPITPPIGVRPITPPIPPAEIIRGSRIAPSRIISTGCCPECAVCTGGMGMCDPTCGFGNCCMGGMGGNCCMGGCGGMGGMGGCGGCGCPFDETCRACFGCRCYF